MGQCWPGGAKCQSQSAQGLWAMVRATNTHLNSLSGGADVISISEASFCCVGDKWWLGGNGRTETSSEASQDTKGTGLAAGGTARVSRPIWARLGHVRGLGGGDSEEGAFVPDSDAL